MTGRDRPSVEPRQRVIGFRRSGSDSTSMQCELRERIEAGTYCVDPSLVAEAMIVRMRGERASAVLVPPQPADLDAIGSEQDDAGAFGDSA